MNLFFFSINIHRFISYGAYHLAIKTESRIECDHNRNRNNLIKNTFSNSIATTFFTIELDFFSLLLLCGYLSLALAECVLDENNFLVWRHGKICVIGTGTANGNTSVFYNIVDGENELYTPFTQTESQHEQTNETKTGKTKEWNRKICFRLRLWIESYVYFWNFNEDRFFFKLIMPFFASLPSLFLFGSYCVNDSRRFCLLLIRFFCLSVDFFLAVFHFYGFAVFLFRCRHHRIEIAERTIYAIQSDRLASVQCSWFIVLRSNIFRNGKQIRAKSVP